MRQVVNAIVRKVEVILVDYESYHSIPETKYKKSKFREAKSCLENENTELQEVIRSERNLRII